MKATPDAIKQVIQSQGLDTLTAEDVGTGDKVGYCEGSAAELCEHVDFLVASLGNPFRLRLSQSKVDRKRGARTAADKPFVFIVEPNRAPQPVNESRPHLQPAPAVPLDFARDAGAAMARADFHEQQVERLQAEIEAMRKELDERTDEDEDEDEDEPVNAAPLPWYESEAFGKWVMETFTPIGRALGTGIAAKLGAPPMPTKPAADRIPAAAPPADADADERRILEALRRWRTADPDTSEHYLKTLVDNFAADQPPTDEAAQ